MRKVFREAGHDGEEFEGPCFDFDAEEEIVDVMHGMPLNLKKLAFK